MGEWNTDLLFSAEICDIALFKSCILTFQMTNVSVLWCAAVRDVLCTQFANNWTYYKKRAITLLPLVDSEQHCTKAGKTLQKTDKIKGFCLVVF